MFLFKEGLSLIIRRLSFNSKRNFLFSLVRTLKFSKDGEWLQSNKWLLTALPLGLTFFLVNGEIPICSLILTLRCLMQLIPNSIVQQKKFFKRSTQNPEKVIFNFSNYVLSDCENPLLTKGLKYTLQKVRLCGFPSCLMKTWILLKPKLRKQHYLLIDLTMIIYLKIHLRKNSLLYKTSFRLDHSEIW